MGFLGITIFLGLSALVIFAVIVYAFAAAVTGGIMLMIKRNNYFDNKRKYMSIAGYSLICIGCIGFISLSSCAGSCL